MNEGAHTEARMTSIKENTTAVTARVACDVGLGWWMGRTAQLSATGQSICLFMNRVVNELWWYRWQLASVFQASKTHIQALIIRGGKLEPGRKENEHVYVERTVT